MSINLIILTILLNIFFIFYEIFKGKYILIYYKLFSLFLIFQAGFRPIKSNVDNLVYINVYEKIIPTISQNYLFIIKFRYFEKIYTLINILLKTLGLNYRALFIVISAISISIISFTILKICKYKFLCIFIYITNFYYINEFIIIRAGVAIAIIFLAMTFLNKNKKLYILLIIIAMGFHRTMVLALIPLIIFMLPSKFIYSLKNVFFSLILFFLLGKYISDIILNLNLDVLNRIFSSKLNYYLMDFTIKGNYRKLILYFPLLIFFIKNKKRYQKSLYFKEAISFLISANALMLLFVFNLNFQRIPYLFGISQIYLIDCIIVNIKKKINKVLYCIVLIVFENIILIWMLRIYKEVLY